MSDERTTGETRVRAGIVDVVVIAADPGATPPWRVLALRRGVGTRCTGAWEIVHGRIEQGETPPAAARRELAEETGLRAERLYSITVNPFYLQATDTVELAVVFAAVVAADAPPTLAEEHDRAEWLSPDAAMSRLAWPREREAVAHAMLLLATGDAGAVEDVLRVPDR